MKRVLHCVSTLEIGGVETQVIDSLTHFAAKGSGYEHFLCAFRGGRLESTILRTLLATGGQCEILGRRSRFDLTFIRKLRDTVAKIRPDIIHAYNPGASLWTRLVLGGNRTRRILVHCGGIRAVSDFKWRLIERTLLARTAGFIFNSKATRCVWEQRLPIHCPRCVIHNGVSVDREAHSHEPPPLSPFVLLTICRITPIKSLSTQLQALSILHGRGQTDVRLVIVGDGPIRQQLESEVNDLGLSDAVAFEGFQPNPEAYHARAHVYLCTSYNETFSQTLAKAMADGMICIAGRVGGPSEIIEDGVNGFLVPCTEPIRASVRQLVPSTVYDAAERAFRPPLGVNPLALAEKIADARGRYVELAPMRTAAQRRILDCFSQDRYCDAIQEFYGEL